MSLFPLFTYSRPRKVSGTNYILKKYLTVEWMRIAMRIIRDTSPRVLTQVSGAKSFSYRISVFFSPALLHTYRMWEKRNPIVNDYSH